ncbi:molybdate ABC transporter substrate-binding protein [Meiothermus granaticius]|uniref:Molybdate-binding periplasmic protein n=1 Tax=Meiothermus granaticius NBRC 107808 TaxID=1227551 RepID=A0A399F5M5_9DEIN|nr:molybdate ABC transporter substrate-binding protein [Meiothermus granaticius]RIH91373.1 Molybdate-binding periplasmic protein [Meiothermus granaticius NBRC 107808]GEM86922.1 molybdate-binding protein [Meiothermus granaticius NBRC 107808]
MNFKRYVGAFLLAASLAHAQNDTVRVVAAADLQYALSDIVQRFEAQNPDIKVQLTFGSSGKFYTQISQGLPADLFFSADEAFAAQLEKANLIVPGTRKLYAVGRMVIWVSNGLVAQGLNPQALGPKLLLDPKVTRIAIADPVHAPYGRAAVTLLQYFGLLRQTKQAEWENMGAGIPAFYDIATLKRGKPSFEFVYGENISQTAQLALTSTGVGLIALSIAKSEAMSRGGQYWLSPLSSHMRLNQNYVILKGQDRPAVRKFYDYIASTTARQIFKHYGFLLPGEKLED